MAAKTTAADRKRFLEQLDIATGGAIVELGGIKAKVPTLARPGRILLAVDGTEGSKPAVAWAAHLAAVWRAHVTIVCVAPPRDEIAGAVTKAELVDRIYHEYEEDAQAILARTAAELAAAGLKAATRLERGSPAGRITAAAKAIGADLVVLGAHGHGVLERFQLGSVADSVKNSVRCSVLIARAKLEGAVVAAVDGSVNSLVAADAAEQIAVASQGHAKLLRCVNVPRFGRAELPEELARQAQVNLGRPGGAAGIVHYRVTRGSVAKAIADFAEEQAVGLVVVGSRGLGAVRSTLLGSVSNRVSQRAHCSVLVVKQPA